VDKHAISAKHTWLHKALDEAPEKVGSWQPCCASFSLSRIDKKPAHQQLSQPTLLFECHSAEAISKI
jgi:hypothetical protein